MTFGVAGLLRAQGQSTQPVEGTFAAERGCYWPSCCGADLASGKNLKESKNLETSSEVSLACET
jgi:hypothetical protein